MKGSNTEWRAWGVCLSGALFFFYVFIQINLFNALSPALIRAFNIPTTALGNLAAAYFITNVVCLFPAGMLLDRSSTRRVILLAQVLTVIATFWFALATNFLEAEICRLLIGVSGAFCLISCVRLVSRWFPPQRMALVVGVIVTMAMLGGITAQTPLTLLTDAIGWRHALLLDGLLGLIIVLVIASVVKDNPPHLAEKFKQQQQHLHSMGFWQALSKTMSNTQNWFAGIYASLINLPIFILGTAWGSLFLVESQHLNREDASIVNSMLFLGMIIGCPLVGWFSDRIRRRKMPMTVGAVFSLAIMLLIMFLPKLTFISLLVLFFALGFIISSQILAYPLVAESNPESLIGTAEGLAATLIMAGGWLISIFPDILNWHWHHVMRNHIPFYTTNEFRLALAIMPIGFVIALLASISVRETFCEAVKGAEISLAPPVIPGE